MWAIFCTLIPCTVVQNFAMCVRMETEEFFECKILVVCHVGLYQNSRSSFQGPLLMHFWTNIKVWKPNVHHCAKFHENQPNGFGDITILFIFKTVAIQHLGFPKFHIFSSLSCWEGLCAHHSNFIKIGQTVAKRRPSTLLDFKQWIFAFNALTLLVGRQEGHLACKKLSVGVLAWLSVWGKVQICIRPSWCQCHSLSLAPVNPD